MMLCVWQVSHGKKAEKIDFGYHSPIVISSAEDVDAEADINLKDDAGNKVFGYMALNVTTLHMLFNLIRSITVMMNFVGSDGKNKVCAVLWFDCGELWGQVT